jgi:hypothetical protein
MPEPVVKAFGVIKRAAAKVAAHYLCHLSCSGATPPDTGPAPRAREPSELPWLPVAQAAWPACKRTSAPANAGRHMLPPAPPYFGWRPQVPAPMGEPWARHPGHRSKPHPCCPRR